MKPFHIVETKDAPKALGCYSQALRAGSLMWLSGQIGLSPISGELVEGIEGQLEQIFKNIHAVLSAAKLGMENVIKLTIFLKNIEDFPLVNESMARHFAIPYPARSTVEVSNLPKGALVEIEAVAVC